jgi:hypothetical protein
LFSALEKMPRSLLTLWNMHFRKENSQQTGDQTLRSICIECYEEKKEGGGRGESRGGEAGRTDTE